MLSSYLILLGFLLVADAQKTLITIYYESLSPDSQEFITKQLHPAMKYFKHHIDLNLIPFGKSTYKTQGSAIHFDCIHGSIECYGNKIHACAIKHVNESQVFDYISCLMGSYTNESYSEFAKKCAVETHVEDFNSIEECARDTEGSNLLREMGDRTNKFEQPLRYVPTIVLNESFYSDIQDKALIDFVNAVCPHLSKPTPKVCEFDEKENDKRFNNIIYLVLTLIVFIIIGFLLIFYRESIREIFGDRANERRQAGFEEHQETTINNDKLDETQPMPTDSTL